VTEVNLKSFKWIPIFPVVNRLSGRSPAHNDAVQFFAATWAASIRFVASKSTSAEGRPLHGAAKNSFMAKCKRDA
jgi:hypothetical protein